MGNDGPTSLNGINPIDLTGYVKFTWLILAKIKDEISWLECNEKFNDSENGKNSDMMWSECSGKFNESESGKNSDMMCSH